MNRQGAKGARKASIVVLTLACTEFHEAPASAEPEIRLPPGPVLECRYDPVSFEPKANEPLTGADMCFTQAVEAGEDALAETIFARLYDTEDDAGACPADMILIDGAYCPDVKHECNRYIDDQGPGGFLAHHRCAEFAKNPKCRNERQLRRFCIDRDEYAPPGETLPLVNQSWTVAKETCESLGKRLCFGSEWEFACEGESMLPYPYGFDRNAKLCNHDRTDLSARGKLRDLRVAADARPACVSPFGARNLVGNVDEWVIRDGFVRPWRSALHGGWWLAGRNNCRASTTAHDEFYFGPQTGFRCCRNPQR